MAGRLPGGGCRYKGAVHNSGRLASACAGNLPVKGLATAVRAYSTARCTCRDVMDRFEPHVVAASAAMSSSQVAAMVRSHHRAGRLATPGSTPSPMAMALASRAAELSTTFSVAEATTLTRLYVDSGAVRSSEGSVMLGSLAEHLAAVAKTWTASELASAARSIANAGFQSPRLCASVEAEVASWKWQVRIFVTYRLCFPF